jgi:superfamily II DNA or RNA helicase
VVVLRDTQTKFVEDIRVAMRSHRRVLGVAPTGFGKTVCFSHIAQEVAGRGLTVTLAAHRIEIVRQIGKALTRERVRHGFIAPDYPESSAPVQVGMIQTIGNRLGRLRQPNLFIPDEAHHAVSGSYMKIMQAWPDAYVLGVTATPSRLDGRGLGDAFDVLVKGPTMRELQDRGFLSRYTYYAPPVQANLAGLRKTAGDYSAADSAKAMDTRRVHGDIIEHYKDKLNGKPALAFCATVEHAHNMAAAFREAGWQAAAVDGKTRDYERERLIASIGDGRLNVLCSCDVVSEGTDIPAVQGAILARPTLSLVLYLQQIGRALRPKADGSRTIILDHVGNIHRGHGMPDAPRKWDLSGAPARAQAAAVKQCPVCYCCHQPARLCPACGHEYVAAPAPARTVPKMVRGQLVEVSGVKAQAKAEKPKVKHAVPFKQALNACWSYDDVQAMAKERGYSPFWVHRVWPFVKSRIDARNRREALPEAMTA